MIQLEWIFKPILQAVIFLLLLFLVVFFNLSNKYYRNSFTISLNDKPLYVYYKEDYRRMLIPILLDAKSHVESGNTVEPVINELEVSDKYILDIKEYMNLFKDNFERKPGLVGWYVSENTFLSEQKFNDKTLVIKRMNNIIYKGDYISDITDYIKEPGRYYFQLISKRKENSGLIKTHITFNVIIGGGNHD